MVSVSSTRETEFIDYMLKTDVPFSALGHVTKGEIRIDDVSYGFICDIRNSYDEALGKAMAE